MRHYSPTRPRPVVDLVATTASYYSDFYTRNKEDSPDFSRTSLLRRARRYTNDLGSQDYVLDLGAGRQILERMYVQAYGRPRFGIVTVDIADIGEKILLTARYPINIRHVRANGAQLPFPHNSFPLVLSNMALDFMPRNAISEMYRVTRPSGHALVNLHHPSLIPANLDELLEKSGTVGWNHRRNVGRIHPEVLAFWKYLRDNRILFENPYEIRTAFSEHGFIVQDVRETSKREDTWWEVDLLK